MNNGIGFGNSLFFVGVVEDRNDPRKLGRVKVRCFGVHPEDRELVPTEDLPWALMVSGTYGNNIKPPEHGRWVVGFFIDGEEAQHPIVMGTITSMPTNYSDPVKGFNDPEGLYPDACEIYQPDISRLARGEDIQNTQVLAKETLRTKEIPTANGDSWEQPRAPYNGAYPDNKVEETKSGHLFELDDTPGSERVHLYHTAGSFYEVDNTGTRTEKVVGDSYVIRDRNENVYVRGAKSVTIEGDSQVYIMGNATVKVDGNMTQTVHGDYTLNVGGQMNVNVAESYKLRSASVILEAFKDNIDIYGEKKVKIKNNQELSIDTTGEITVKGGANFNVTSAQNSDITAGAQINLKSSGRLAGDGSQIHWNSGVSTSANSSTLAVKRTEFQEAPEKKQVETVTYVPYVGTHYGDEIGIQVDDLNLDDTGIRV